MHRNLSREAHLWYTITSPEYMDQARDHLQAACDRFIACARRHAFIAGYAPVPYWGGKMESLLQAYANARSMLVQGEYQPMIAFGGGLEDIPRGLQEGNTAWLEGDADSFWKSLDSAYSICSTFWLAVVMSQRFTSEGYLKGEDDWRVFQPTDAGIVGDHIARNYEESIFIPLPTEIPEYQADKTVSCATGQIVPWTGVWVPADGMGKAALAFARKNIQIMQPAYHLVVDDEETGDEEYELVDCIWHPVRPTGRMIPHPLATAQSGAFNSSASSSELRCPAGRPCPQAGWWSTPAKIDSRRQFNQGEVMPDFDSDYGATIWQWDADQSQRRR